MSSSATGEVAIEDSACKVYQLNLSQRKKAAMVCSYTSSLINSLSG